MLFELIFFNICHMICHYFRHLHVSAVALMSSRGTKPKKLHRVPLTCMESLINMHDIITNIDIIVLGLQQISQYIVNPTYSPNPRRKMLKKSVVHSVVLNGRPISLKAHIK